MEQSLLDLEKEFNRNFSRKTLIFNILSEIEKIRNNRDIVNVIEKIRIRYIKSYIKGFNEILLKLNKNPMDEEAILRLSTKDMMDRLDGLGLQTNVNSKNFLMKQKEAIDEFKIIPAEKLMSTENIYQIVHGRNGHTMPRGMSQSKELEQLIRFRYNYIFDMVEKKRINQYVRFVFHKLQNLNVDIELIKSIIDPNVSFNEYDADYRDELYQISIGMGEWIDKNWKKIHHGLKEKNE